MIQYAHVMLDTYHSTRCLHSFGRIYPMRACECGRQLHCLDYKLDFILFALMLHAAAAVSVHTARWLPLLGPYRH